MNYTGLRRGDSDFEGYISKGDINMNDLIDAYDISVVATQLDGGVDREATEKVSGSLSISTPKKQYQKDEIVEIRVKGNDLRSVNALSFALPYDQSDYEFVGVEPLNMKAMENLTYDRLHTNGVIYNKRGCLWGTIGILFGRQTGRITFTSSPSVCYLHI